MSYNILALGDIVGPEAVSLLSQRLWGIRRELSASFVVANGENACIGNGIDADSAKALLEAGVDVITTGNHVWQKKSFRDYLGDSSRVIRPANYPAECPGLGWTILDGGGVRILAINILGTVYLDPLDSPFRTIERILEREAGNYDLSLLDVHAEATSEKIALARYFDGRIDCIFGTHTHVQTADECILPKGSGYITDLGMTGPLDSILGVRADCIIEKFLTKMPVRFEIAPAESEHGAAGYTGIPICGALFKLNGMMRVEAVERIRI